MDINDGIEKLKRDVHDKPFKKLKAATVRSKRRKGYSRPSTPLYATGMMKNLLPISGFAAATPQRQRAYVMVAKQRRAIGNIHSRGEPSNNLPPREWFGISDRALKRIQTMLRKRLEHILRKG